MAANNSNSSGASSFRVSCRAHFDAALTGKENKEALKAKVARALAGLGLAIDEGDVRFHHFKLVHKKNKKPKFVVMGMDVVEGPAMAKMKAGAFAEGGPEGADGAFTVRWGAASEPVREAQAQAEPEPGTSARVRPAGVRTPTKEATKETTKETSSQRVGTPPATKPQRTGKKAYTMATSTSAGPESGEVWRHTRWWGRDDDCTLGSPPPARSNSTASLPPPKPAPPPPNMNRFHATTKTLTFLRLQQLP